MPAAMLFLWLIGLARLVRLLWLVRLIWLIWLTLAGRLDLLYGSRLPVP